MNKKHLPNLYSNYEELSEEAVSTQSISICFITDLLSIIYIHLGSENSPNSVLQPVSNPYDKEQKIIEANEALSSEPLANKSPQKVTFSKIERRYSYNSEDPGETGKYGNNISHIML